MASCRGEAARRRTPRRADRGTAPVGAGIDVAFYSGADKVCETVTQQAIDPGQCIAVTCTWTTPPSAQSGAVDLRVVPNDGQTKSECVTENNDGMILDVWCKGTG